MKDKYWAMLVLCAINVACVVKGVPYSKEVVLMTIPVLAAIVRD